MADILSQIAAYKREEVRARKAERSQDAVEAAAQSASPPRGFRAALERAHAPGRLALIAEVKKASPSKGLIRADFNPPALARAYEAGGAACLSVLTDGPSFQGADAILVILAMVDDSLAAELLSESRRLGMDALIEVHDEAEMARAADLGGDLIGVNNRNLRTFQTDLSITERLAALAPLNALFVTESGIGGPADMIRLEASGARAMLVGESLMRQPDVATATRFLLGEHAPLS